MNHRRMQVFAKYYLVKAVGFSIWSAELCVAVSELWQLDELADQGLRLAHANRNYNLKEEDVYA